VSIIITFSPEVEKFGKPHVKT